MYAITRLNNSESVFSPDAKRDFKADNAEILLCIDATAEGLNFKFLSALVNYDMP
ncbi:hypothetical protein OGCDGJMD_02413 [Cyanobium usitatum str. Tous]|uniref:helicase-related protein n=1 Tax=Cyanobium usitatum TaxID=2304190 RepID=UPI003085ABF9|nr:hypothetical protein OGCDGJMD_02413 [Cyanobium usitatum str. Tous]